LLALAVLQSVAGCHDPEPRVQETSPTPKPNTDSTITQADAILIALGILRDRGHLPERFSVRSERGVDGNWWVFVEREPRVYGGHTLLEVDHATGAVIRVSGGR
jgi:hypothetical protein